MAVKIALELGTEANSRSRSSRGVYPLRNKKGGRGLRKGLTGRAQVEVHGSTLILASDLYG